MVIDDISKWIYSVDYVGYDHDEYCIVTFGDGVKENIKLPSDRIKEINMKIQEQLLQIEAFNEDESTD